MSPRHTFLTEIIQALCLPTYHVLWLSGAPTFIEMNDLETVVIIPSNVFDRSIKLLFISNMFHNQNVT